MNLVEAGRDHCETVLPGSVRQAAVVAEEERGRRRQIESCREMDRVDRPQRSRRKLGGARQDLLARPPEIEAVERSKGARDERLLDLGAAQGPQELDAQDHVRDEPEVGFEEALQFGAFGLGENDLCNG